jgi:hypothetical protein
VSDARDADGGIWWEADERGIEPRVCGEVVSGGCEVEACLFWEDEAFFTHFFWCHVGGYDREPSQEANIPETTIF